MIQMKQAFNTALNKHYRCPKGIMGRIAGEVMVRQHRPETAWTLHLLDIQPTDTVLEVGFGAGQGIKLAAERVTSGRIRGIDLSEEMVRVATGRNASAIKAGRVALSQGSITALPFEDQYFDKIMTIHTLYFWPEPHEPEHSLNELCRVLKPAGPLAIHRLALQEWDNRAWVSSPRSEASVPLQMGTSSFVKGPDQVSSNFGDCDRCW